MLQVLLPEMVLIYSQMLLTNGCTFVYCYRHLQYFKSLKQTIFSASHSTPQRYIWRTPFFWQPAHLPAVFAASSPSPTAAQVNPNTRCRPCPTKIFPWKDVASAIIGPYRWCYFSTTSSFHTLAHLIWVSKSTQKAY